MTDYSIMVSVSETLKYLFTKNNPPPSVHLDQSSISFDSPADIHDDNLPKLLIYLYKVSENSSLINAPVDMGKQITFKVEIPLKPPQPVDLHYLMIPYGKDRLAEMIMVEWILDTLYDNSIIDPKYYQGALKNNKDEIKIIQMPLSTNEIYNVWSLFTNKEFKLSLSYMVTPVLLPTFKKEEYYRIVETAISVENIRK